MGLVGRVLLVAPLLAVGCSLIVDSSGLTSSAAAGADASGAATDLEASADAGPPLPEAGCGRYPGASFCVDFDQPSDTLTISTWAEVAHSGAGSISLLDAGAFSPPLAAHIDTGDAGTCLFENLAKQFVPSSRVAARATARLTGPAIVLTTRIDVGDGAFLVLGRVMSGTEIRVQTQRYALGQTTNTGESSAVDLEGTLGAWRDIALDVDWATRQVSFRLGSAVAEVPLPTDFPDRSPNGSGAVVSFGFWCTEPTNAIDVDDVAVFATP